MHDYCHRCGISPTAVRNEIKKLREVLKKAVSILKGCQCLGSDGSKERHKIVEEAQAVIKQTKLDEMD